MAAGILYLGTTSAGLVKAGRTSRPIGVREREFRTVDPGFRIVYTQTVTDVVAAEREMHARLRIVAGTDFKGAGKETYWRGTRPVLVDRLGCGYAVGPIDSGTARGAGPWVIP